MFEVAVRTKFNDASVVTDPAAARAPGTVIGALVR
jgi:hypothetical protein